MSDEISTVDKWNAIYGDGANHVQYAPADVLREFAHLLPARGEALDVACGRGGNALFLAGRGLDVRAWDISPVAIESLQQAASEQGLRVRAEVRDVEACPWERDRFDVIVVSHFLARGLAGAILSALKPDGLLYYQTFLAEKVRGCGPTNPAYLLGENELLHLFSSLRIIFYREEGRVGDLSKGVRNEAQLIGQRRRPILGD